MNWVALHSGEIDNSGRVVLADGRADHIRSVLHAATGSVVRVIIVDGQKGSAWVEGLDSESVTLRVCALEPPGPRPRVDLLLALPRPKVMGRLWMPLASLGVNRIVLTNAEKVERCYFDTHWLQPRTYKAELVRGLEQVGDPHLPEVRVVRRLKPLVEDSLEDVFPDAMRLLALPRGECPLREAGAGRAGRVVIAVGPEGGWSPFEVDLLLRHGFRAVTLGGRALRTDTACVALLAIIHDMLEFS